MTSASDTARTRVIRTDIQGMRALAVLLVLLYHAGTPGFAGGFVGVDLFFVISGFLITGHLISRLESTGSLGLWDFYSRRVRRLLPASFAVLIATAAASWLWLPPVLLERTILDIVATAIYMPNVRFALARTDYLSETSPSVVQHYWSLGVEEQFYLFWPLFLILSWRLWKSRRATTLAVLLVAVLSFMLSLSLLVDYPSWAFFSLPTRAWQLGAGALVALIGPTLRMYPWLANVTSILGLAALAIALTIIDSATTYPGWYAALPTAAGVALTLGGAHHHGVVQRVLGIRALQVVGDASYSIYLVHWPLLTIPDLRLQEGLNPSTAAALALLAIPLGWLSYKFIEGPFRRPKVSSQGRCSVFICAIMCSALIAGIALTARPAIEGRFEVSTGRYASAFEPHNGPLGNPELPANLKPSLWEASEDIPSIYANNCVRPVSNHDSSACRFGHVGSDAPAIALVGDSHAAQWFPALERIADEGGFGLLVYTKSSCGLVPRPRESGDCPTWRDGVLTELRQEPPDYLLLGQYFNGPHPYRNLREQLDTMVAKLPSGSVPLFLADTPYASRTPALCLSVHPKHTDACSLDPTRAIDEVRLEALRSAPGYRVIDLNGFFCNESKCPTVIDDVLVYRDAHHITSQFASRLSGVLAEALLLSPVTNLEHASNEIGGDGP